MGGWRGEYGPHICEYNPKSAICREIESRIEELGGELEGGAGVDFRQTTAPSSANMSIFELALL